MRMDDQKPAGSESPETDGFFESGFLCCHWSADCVCPLVVIVLGAAISWPPWIWWASLAMKIRLVYEFLRICVSLNVNRWHSRHRFATDSSCKFDPSVSTDIVPEYSSVTFRVRSVTQTDPDCHMVIATTTAAAILLTASAMSWSLLLSFIGAQRIHCTKITSATNGRWLTAPG